VRVVVDTNVLMSGIFFGGTPGRIVEALKLSQITLAASPSIIEEYQRVAEELESTYGELEAGPLITLLAAPLTSSIPQAFQSPCLATPMTTSFSRVHSPLRRQ